jgi:pyruvate,water dikinase
VVGVADRVQHPTCSDEQATEADVGDIERVETKITMNLANPEQAYSLQFIPNDGVGLVRMEFIVSNHIRAHPMALLHPEKLQQVRFGLRR